MQGVYARYRVQKRKKLDLGLAGSQESGYSLIEVADAMPDLVPPSDEEQEREEQEGSGSETSQRDR